MDFNLTFKQCFDYLSKYILTVLQAGHSSVKMITSYVLKCNLESVWLS